MTPTVRVGVDVGGTFTDLVAIGGPGSSDARRAKVPTTPEKLEAGVFHGLAALAVEPESIADLVHGTTIAINTITQRSGCRVALVTTKGFRDVLLIGRGNRPDIYNLTYRKPTPFVDRHHSFELVERTTHEGVVLEAVGDADLESLSAELRSAQVDAVALCFLHAWANPANEERAEAGLRSLLPDKVVVSSHSTSRQWREYERASTTVLSAYVAPKVRSYVESLQSSLRSAGAGGALRIMRSNGGVSSFAAAARRPISLLESGPAAGVMAAAALGRNAGLRHVLTIDIGGTTAKASAVRDGNVEIKPLHHVEWTRQSAGYPVQGPIVDIVEIGAGGGSVASGDESGRLHVGPQSAGSSPGPACYGWGGSQPTVTDANLVAGRLDPAFFLGGAMTLHPEEATEALTSLGRRLGIDSSQAARGVLRVGVALMANALRLVTLQRGHDPREFTLVAFGGAGPLHASLLARELGIGEVIVPPNPGHFSAYGMLSGELRSDAIQTCVVGLGTASLKRLSSALAAVEEEAYAEIGADAVVSMRRSVDLRYAGQEHTLEVAVPEGPVDESVLQVLGERLARRSSEQFGFSLTAPIEVVAVRANAAAAVPELPAPASCGCGCGGRDPSPRRVDLDHYGGVREVVVLDRCRLEPGATADGPLMIEETAATTLVLPGQQVRSDELWNLRILETE